MLFPGPIVVLLLLASSLQQCPLVTSREYKMHYLHSLCPLFSPPPRNKGEILANPCFANYPSPCGLTPSLSSEGIRYSSEITPEFGIVVDA